jgi:hypothetical protein
MFSQKAEILHHAIEGADGSRKMTFVIGEIQLDLLTKLLYSYYSHALTLCCTGTDTMVRITDAKYYGNSQKNMIAALEDMKRKGVHFIVGGRLEQGNER